MKQRKFLCPACGKKFSLYQMPDHLDSCPDRKHYKQHLALFQDLDEYRNRCYMDAEIDWVEEHCQEVE